MRKGLLLLMLALVCDMAIHAESVNRTEALQKATAFMRGKGIGISRQMTEVARAPRKKAGQTAAPCYYVFNADRGFVIVSGDDRTVPVLGYSLSDSFNPDSIPENMRAWLQGYADLIDNLDSLGVTAKYDEPAKTDRAKTQKAADGRLTAVPMAAPRQVVSPLLTSTWNQGHPYQDNCPPFPYQGNNYYSATGCVATAMAQVINYHKYPDAIITDIPSYVTRTHQTKVSGISAGSVIDWDNMADNYDNYQNMTTASKRAVANLMLYCGVSVEMDYSRSSGAYSRDVSTALKKYFGYDENVYCAQRSDYTIAEWDALLINELTNNRPIIYGAQSMGGGHEFVLDGYDGELYHVNWGWGGHCDGYFAVSVLNPNSTEGIGASSTPDGYSMGQDATIGVQPPGYPNPAIPDKVFNDRLISKNLHVNGSEVGCEMYNQTGADNDFEVGYTFVNMDTGRDFTINCGWGTLPADYYFPEISLDLSGVQQNGTYKVYPVSRIRGAEEWLDGVNKDRVYVIVNITDGVVTAEVHPTVHLSAIDFDVPRTPSVGQEQVITATVNNLGEEYNGNLYFVSRIDGETKYTLFGRTGVAIPEGGSTGITMYFTPEVEKNHHIYISTVAPDNYGAINENNIIGDCLLTFGGEVPVVDLKVVSLGTYNEPIVGEDFDFYVSIKNNGDDYSGPLHLFYASKRMYEEEKRIYRGMYYNNIKIAAGNTVDVEFSFIPDEPGDYCFWIGTDSEAQNIIAGYTFTVGERVDMEGDVNGDGRLNVADLVALSKYIADAEESQIQTHKADLTGDGRITVADVVELARRIANQ